MDYALEMKTLFIDVKGKKELNIKLPKGKVGLISSIQYLDQLKELNIKDSVYGGVVLGCNADNAVKIKDKVDFYFFLGEGRFHAMNAAVKTGKEVYIASGDKISHEDIEKYKKELKGKILKYLNAKKKGILISTKEGQSNIKEALKLKNKIQDSYLFIENTFDFSNLENFKDIDIWINTACSRIEGKNIINMEDLPKV